MRKHYVDFLSPGTFVSEESSAPIEDWDTHKAAQMATHILERYGARPYAFRFRTMLTRDPLPDGEGGLFQVQPKEVAKSGLHFICGEVIRYDDIPDDDKARRILKANMRNTDCALAVETRNGYRHTTVRPIASLTQGATSLIAVPSQIMKPTGGRSTRW